MVRYCWRTSHSDTITITGHVQLDSNRNTFSVIVCYTDNVNGAYDINCSILYWLQLIFGFMWYVDKWPASHLKINGKNIFGFYVYHHQSNEIIKTNPTCCNQTYLNRLNSLIACHAPQITYCSQTNAALFYKVYFFLDLSLQFPRIRIDLSELPSLPNISCC